MQMCVNVPVFDWFSKYGLLAKTRGGTEWEELTGKEYEEPSNEEPPATRPKMKKKRIVQKQGRKKEKRDCYKTSCYTRFGACKAVCHNIRRVLDGKYYEQLEDELMGYKDVTIRNYFEHLDAKWCRMDTKTPKKMKAEFYQPWDQVMHITKFGKHLNQ